MHQPSDEDDDPSLGVTIRSEGHRVSARSCFSLPLSIQEPSVLRLDWEETGGAEVDFSASFAGVGSASATLVQPERLTGHPGGLVEVDSSGTVRRATLSRLTARHALARHALARR